METAESDGAVEPLRPPAVPVPVKKPAVRLSPRLVFAVDWCSERHVPMPVKKHLLGHLGACGAEVPGLRIRFPLIWHNATEPGWC